MTPLPPGSIETLRPELLLTGAGVLILLLEAFLPQLRRLANPLAIVSIIGATYLVTVAGYSAAAVGGLIECTPVTQGASQIILIAALLSLGASGGYLRREGLEGQEGGQGEERHREQLDLLITDVVLPGVRGTEVARFARVRSPSLPVLFITGYVDDERGREQLATEEVLEKPFDTTALTERVRSLLQPR